LVYGVDCDALFPVLYAWFVAFVGKLGLALTGRSTHRRRGRAMSGFALDHIVEVFVPTKCRCKQELPEDVRRAELDRVKKSLFTWFGGGYRDPGRALPVHRVEGGYVMSETGELVEEANDVVCCNASAAQVEEYGEDVAHLAREMGQRLAQESAACRIDGRMQILFITPGACVCRQKPAPPWPETHAMRHISISPRTRVHGRS